MIYSFEELKPFFSGCLRFEEEDGYLFPRRMTPYIEQVMEERNFTPRQFATASVKLDFYAPAGEVRFDFKASRGSSSKHYEYDACVDGVEVFHDYVKYEEDAVCGTVSFTVPARAEGMSRVTFFFPCLAAFGIKNVELPEGARRAMRGTRILMNGDSITHGAFAIHPRLCYANIVGERLNAEVLNHGIGGDKYWAGNLDPALPFTPDIITVAYGTNDWAACIPDLADRIDNYYKKLRAIYPNTPILAIPPIWRGNTDGVLKNGLSLEDVRNIVRDTARRYDCHIADDRRLVPPHADFYWDKTLHPNDLGFTFYGEAIANQINEILHNN